MDVKIKENTDYTIQVNAYEDGLIDCEDNWPKPLFYKASKTGIMHETPKTFKSFNFLFCGSMFYFQLTIIQGWKLSRNI